MKHDPFIQGKNSSPPKYTIRKSKRAKKLILKVSAQKGIECVIPYYASNYEAEQMLQKNRPWIEQQLQRLSSQNKGPAHKTLPDEILLRSVNQLWEIDYIADTKRPRIHISQADQQLLIRGQFKISDAGKLLHSWLKKQAKMILTPWLNELSHETGLSYKELKIRHQMTLWGSCTSHKNINLNYKLLFLPDVLAENIMLHELCHTVHMNHSEKFWGLMQKYNSKALIYNKEIKQAQKYIPDWVEKKSLDIL